MDRVIAGYAGQEAYSKWLFATSIEKDTGKYVGDVQIVPSNDEEFRLEISICIIKDN